MSKFGINERVICEIVLVSEQKFCQADHTFGNYILSQDDQISGDIVPTHHTKSPK